MAREFLWIVKESAFKTPKTSPVAGTDSIYIRLDGGNAFTMRPTPVQVAIPVGNGVAVNGYRVSDKLVCKGNLQVKLCASQAKLLLDWASTRINSGQTSPWTTTEPAGDLASCAVYHAIQRSDGSYKRRVYLGCKVTDWEVESSEEAQITTLKLGLLASTPQGNAFDSSADPSSVAFPAPADTAFPTDAYLFIHTSGALSMGGSTRDQVTRIKVGSKNAIAVKHFNNRFAQLIRWLGRETTLEATLLYAPSPDDRTSLEGTTSQACSVAWDNGTLAASLELNAQNVYTGLDDDLPLNDVYMQAGTLENLWDASAGGDLLWTVA